MTANPHQLLKVEHDFQALCAALEGLDDEQRLLFLAKLALVLCDLVEDRTVVRQAIERSKLNLAGAPG